MSLYLVTDAETGTAVLIEAKRSDGAISIAVANRFVASAVSVREAFDLGTRGVKLIDPEADENEQDAADAVPPAPVGQEEAGFADIPASSEPDLPRFLSKKNTAAPVPPPEGDAAQVEAAPPVVASTDTIEAAQPEEGGKSLFERMSKIARGEAPAHEDEAKVDA